MTPTRRRTGIQLDPDQVRYASGQAEGTPPDATTAAATNTKARRTTRSSKEPAPAPAEVNEANPDAKEGEAYPGEPTIKVGTAIPETLKHQMDGLVRYAQDTGEIPGVVSLVDVFRIALHRYVRQAQLDYNDGEEFKVPRFIRRGRPPR